MAKRNSAKSKNIRIMLITVAILLVIIIVAAVVIYIVKPEIFDKLFNRGKREYPSAAAGTETEIAQSDFSIHFLELGNKYAGDSVLIDCGDTELLIDAGSKYGSAPTITEYINKYCDDGVLEYVIATHAHEDHIAAFAGDLSGKTPTGVLYNFTVGTLIKFDFNNTQSQTYKHFEDAADHVAAEGASVYTASQCYYERDGAKRRYYLDEAQTLSFNILYNYYYEHTDSKENNYSVVTLLTKSTAEGDKHYLFTGDMEEKAEKKMVEYYADSANSKSPYDILPEVELYKAAHHGSNTSSCKEFLEVIKPKYVAVCCVAGSPEYTTKNLNTFPTQNTIDNLSLYTDKIYVTSLATDLPVLNGGKDGNFAEEKWNYAPMNGNIVFYYAAGEFKLWCSENDTVLKDTEWFKNYREWHNA